MTPKLRAMLVSTGVFILAGVGVYIYTPTPAARTMEELRDAGILDLQRIVLECPERLTAQTKRRIESIQPGQLRPSQSYARVARTARCHNPDGGNCLTPATGAMRLTDLYGEIVVPSLRRDLTDVDDAGSGSGDGDDIDDSLQYAYRGCEVFSCPVYDALVDAAQRPNPFSPANFCGSLNRLMLVPSPCMMPNGWGRSSDGGWCEEEQCAEGAGYRPCGPGDTCGEVDCKFTGVLGLPDGGPRWNGFNAKPASLAVGTACVPVECSVLAGDVPSEWL